MERPSARATVIAAAVFSAAAVVCAIDVAWISNDCDGGRDVLGIAAAGVWLVALPAFVAAVVRDSRRGARVWVLAAVAAVALVVGALSLGVVAIAWSLRDLCDISFSF